MLTAAALSFSDPERGQALLKLGQFLAAAAFVVGRLAPA
jgi:geranylgeranylglycerol-phosphate geranylgeranyltransferase